ncbi:MAG: EAL domain-containing protein [Candidatus Sumerlaeaceae bacterium]
MSATARTENELSLIVKQLRTTLGKMELVLSSISESIVWTTQDGIIEWCNGPFDRLLRQGHICLLGKSLFANMPLQQGGVDITPENHPIQRAIRSGPGLDVFQFFQDGETRHLEFAWSLTAFGDGEKTAVLTIRDITESRMVQDALEQEIKYLHLYESISATANEATDLNHILLFCITRICEEMAWPIGHTYHVTRHEGKARLEPGALWFLADPIRFQEFRSATELTFLEPGQGLPGTVFQSRQPTWFLDVSTNANFPRAPIARLVGLKSAFAFPILSRGEVVTVLEFFSCDVEEPNKRFLEVLGYFGTALGRAFEIKQSEESLTFRALHDSLTGLPNRVLFVNTVRQAILRRLRHSHDYNFAVLFLDLDRFKIINDSLGHPFGDALLIEVARRLLTSVRAGDMVARIGGDEFAVFLDDLPPTIDCRACHETANRMQKALVAPFQLDSHAVYTAASIGVALSQTGYSGPDEILRDADIAMYRAKANGGARTQIFDSVMHDKAVQRLLVESELRTAVERNELVLYYQPVCRVTTGAIVGFEALLRWQHPQRGMIPPSEFIQIAEETRQIISIGEWVISEACRWRADLERKLPHASRLTISVNVSGQQFTNPGLVEHIQSVLAETGLDAEKLNLEITEGVMMERVAKIQTVLEQLQKIRVHLHVDDFGTGYSSLSYLSRLPIHTLKIDRSFVMGLESSEDNVEIIRCILVLAKTLKMSVIAEGVETLQAAEKLSVLGCRLVQGHYYSMPLDGSSAENLIAGRGAPINTPFEGLQE